MKTHIISHTHWDREWYKPFQFFHVKLHYLMRQVFALLESNPDYKYFMLDGQMVMIEDYLKTHPKSETKIRKYVQEGRLIIGPWYTQPDEFAVDGESLIRNLLIGIHSAKKFGPYMKIGYLPDAFGHTSQMPHILQGFDIDSAVVMRGVPIHKLNRTEFKWSALNGDTVFTVALPTGYSNGMFMPSSNEGMTKRFTKAIHDLKQYGNTKYFLIMNGVDHQFPQDNITKFIAQDQEHFVHSTLRQYITDAQKDADSLMTIQDELITPVTNRVHTSIASSRMYQKSMNRKLQAQLTNQTEPLITFAWLSGAEYPKELVNEAWKILLKNQIHDSIGGCCTDGVHQEMEIRFNDVDSITSNIIKTHSRAIAALSQTTNLELLVFNSAMVVGTQMVTADIYTDKPDFLLKNNEETVPYEIQSQTIVDAAALSIWALYMDTPCPVYKTTVSFLLDFTSQYEYQNLSIIETEKQASIPVTLSNQTTFDNPYQTVTIKQNGSFDLFDKKTKKTYHNFNLFEDVADGGDTYNYSPIMHDTVCTSKTIKNSTIDVQASSLKTTVTVAFDIETPIKLVEQDTKRSSERNDVNYATTITMYPNHRRIDIETTINNTVEDHRVRALFPTELKTDVSHAETQFGVIQRPIKADMSLWKENHWSEQPLPIYSMQRFVALTDESAFVGIVNKGLTEYEIYEQESTIAITLFRGVGTLGKANLIVRPGRPSGISVPTPDAQMNGIVTSNYSVLIGEGTIPYVQLAEQASIVNNHSLTTQNYIPLTNIMNDKSSLLHMFEIERTQDVIQKDMIHPIGQKLLRIEPSVIQVSSLKKAETKDAVVLRVYNPTNETVEVSTVKWYPEFHAVLSCNFLEEDKETIADQGAEFTIKKIPPFTARTYLIYTK